MRWDERVTRLDGVDAVQRVRRSVDAFPYAPLTAR
jgi:hypothetical protein